MSGLPDEETPLCKTQSIVHSERFLSLMSTWENATEDYRAENPSPLLLLLTHLGTACVQLMGILGGFAYITSNATVVFPKCSDYTIIDWIFGLHTGHGWICECTSLALWTFPLVCCLLIPFFKYWDFCDSRLYYECLRSKLFLKVSHTPFFSSPVFIFLSSHLAIGLSSILFTGASGWKDWSNMMKVILPFLIPCISFYITIYVGWDLKFFLITLPKFTEYDFEWFQQHMKQSSMAWDFEIGTAFHQLQKEGTLREGDHSEVIFDALKQISTSSGVRRKRIDKNKVSEEGQQNVSTWTAFRKGAKKANALLLGQKGWWVLDLLWMPGDERALDFRIAFRVFMVGVYIISLLILYLFACTVVQFLYMQGHIDENRIPRAFFALQALIIQH